jgi:HD superfamily phosphodiesterase
MSINDGQQRLEAIAGYAKNRLEQVGAQHQEPPARIEYRWLHTLRVANIGKQLAECEHAQVELVIAGCLLHDIATFDEGERQNHGHLGGRIIRPYLQELGYSPEEVENVCYAVASHVTGVADFDHPKTLEAMLVSDADNIDRFGAYRLLEYCLPEMENFDRLITKIEKRIPVLERYRSEKILETEAGQNLFNQRLDLQLAVFKALLKQHAITRMPELST